MIRTASYDTADQIISYINSYRKKLDFKIERAALDNSIVAEFIDDPKDSWLKISLKYTPKPPSYKLDILDKEGNVLREGIKCDSPDKLRSEWYKYFHGMHLASINRIARRIAAGFESDLGYGDDPEYVADPKHVKGELKFHKLTDNDGNDVKETIKKVLKSLISDLSKITALGKRSYQITEYNGMPVLEIPWPEPNNEVYRLRISVEHFKWTYDFSATVHQEKMEEEEPSGTDRPIEHTNKFLARVFSKY